MEIFILLQKGEYVIFDFVGRKNYNQDGDVEPAEKTHALLKTGGSRVATIFSYKKKWGPLIRMGASIR